MDKEKKEKKLSQDEVLKILAQREFLRRKMMSNEVYFFENYIYIENKDGKTEQERSCLFNMFPEQKRVLQEIQENKLNIIIKARQLGMTWLAISHGLHSCLKIPQFTTVILSQTEDYMMEAINRFEYIIERLPKWLIKEYNKENKQFDSMYLYEKHSDQVIIYHPSDENGARITSVVKGLVATEKAGRSITADLIIFDEWAYHQGAEEIFQAAFPIINRPDSGTFVGISSNKRGSFFEEIVKDCLDNGDMGFNLIFLSVFSDPRRTREWYEQTKKTLKNTWMQEYPENISQALSAGELTAFPEFSPSIHVCEPFPIPSHWTRWAAVDNGYRDSFAWYKGAIDEDGNTYVYYEYTRDRQKDSLVHYSDQARKFMADCIIDITEQTKKEIDDLHLGYETDEIHEYTTEKLQYVIFGLDAFNKDSSRGTGKSLLDFYKEGGFNYPPIRAVTDRKLRKDTWHEYLKPYEDEISGKTTAKLQIFSTCKFLIKYIPQLVVEDENPNVVADNSKIDNVYDSVGYLLIGSPRNNSHRPKEEESEVVKFKKEKIKKLNKGKRRKGILN